MPKKRVKDVIKHVKPKRKRDHKKEYARRKYLRDIKKKEVRKRVVDVVYRINNLDELLPQVPGQTDDEYDEYIDAERQAIIDDIRENEYITMEDWVDIMMEEGYSEHDAYELWYYP